MLLSMLLNMIIATPVLALVLYIIYDSIKTNFWPYWCKERQKSIAISYLSLQRDALMERFKDDFQQMRNIADRYDRKISAVEKGMYRPWEEISY